MVPFQVFSSWLDKKLNIIALAGNRARASVNLFTNSRPVILPLAQSAEAECKVQP